MKNSKPLSALLLVSALALAPLAVAGDKLNINKADEAALLKLPEMNEARAKAIVNYRKNTGDFIQLDELELIPQVKPIYPKLKPLLVLE